MLKEMGTLTPLPQVRPGKMNSYTRLRGCKGLPWCLNPGMTPVKKRQDSVGEHVYTVLWSLKTQ